MYRNSDLRLGHSSAASEPTRRDSIHALSRTSIDAIESFRHDVNSRSVERMAHFGKSAATMFDVLPHLGNSIRTRQRRVIAPGVSDVVHKIRGLLVIEL